MGYNDYGVRPHEAILNITWAGQNGELPDPVPYGATDAQIRRWATEAVTTGGVPGIRRSKGASFRGFVVDRFPAGRGVPYNRIFLRPSTPFG